jgi:hypothetical protein
VLLFVLKVTVVSRGVYFEGHGHRAVTATLWFVDPPSAPTRMRRRALLAAALLAQLGAGDAFSYSARPAPGCLGPRVAGGCARLACPALPWRLREERQVSAPRSTLAHAVQRHVRAARSELLSVFTHAICSLRFGCTW